MCHFDDPSPGKDSPYAEEQVVDQQNGGKRRKELWKINEVVTKTSDERKEY